MPWDANSFHKHNHALSQAQSAHAARIANAVLSRSGDEGMAIAVANKNAATHRDMGGNVPMTGLDPNAATMGNPNTGGLAQRLLMMPVDQLRVLVMRSMGSPIGQMAAQVLAKKQMMPDVGQAAQQPSAPPPMPQQGPMQQGLGSPVQMSPQMGVPGVPGPPGQPLSPQAPQPFLAGGGRLPARQLGGGMSTPWWVRSEARESENPTFYQGSTPGRADMVTTAVPPGGYVLPADVVSGYGEGNSEAGAYAIQKALGSGPYGVPLHSMRTRERGPPEPPRGTRLPELEEARGGRTGAPSGAPSVGGVPVKVSHGELFLPPATVVRIGGGNLKHGHDILDEFVKRSRAKDIKKLRTLPGPARD